MLNVKIKRPEPGMKDPMVKDFTFTIQDPKTGLSWVYICVLEKNRGRKHLVRLGTVDETEIQDTDQVYVCADCGAVALKREDLLPMSDAERQAAPSLHGHCPKCKEGFCILVNKDELSQGPNAFEPTQEVSNERQQ